MNIYIASHKRSAKPKKDGSPSQTVFFTVGFFQEDPKSLRDFLENGNGWKPAKFLLSGWCLREGLVRPPSMAGNSVRHFFPHFIVPGLDSDLLHTLYYLVEELAKDYNVPLAPYEQAMQPCLLNDWHRKNLENLKL
jgi:hypothetical protein